MLSGSVFGTVETGIFLRERQYFRTIQTKQRYTNKQGNLAETQLLYDPKSERVRLGVGKDEADTNRAKADILAFLKRSGKPQTEDIIDDNVHGSTKILRDALRELVTDGSIERTVAAKEKGGRGRKPYVYSIPKHKKS